MKLVLVESPYAGEVERNLAYVRACMKDCLRRGEAPFASHALYTQPGVLDDENPAERQLGIDAGLCWGAKADLSAFYLDLGMTSGMHDGRANAVKTGRVFVERSLPDDLLLETLYPWQNTQMPMGTRERLARLIAEAKK